MAKLIYLDNAAATPLAAEVFASMLPYFIDRFYNPSASYLLAEAIKNDVENARSRVAQILGSRQPEIIFTSGATESNNLAIVGVTRHFPGSNTVVSAVEHESILAPARAVGAKIAPVEATGIVEVNKLIDLIDEQTVLVSVMLANNEIGTVEPLAKIAERLRLIRHERRLKGNKRPLYFHTDATQAANYLDLHVAKLGVDLMSLNGGKIYGPKASGILYVSSDVNLEPIILGGGQERSLRSGTENVAGIIGFAEALELVQGNRRAEAKRLQALQELFFNLINQKIPTAIVNGSTKFRLPNNIHLTFPGQDNERLILGLDEAGILAAAGSACSASAEEPSHVLLACGLSKDSARASLRFTTGQSTTESDITQTVDVMTKLLV